MPIGVVFALIVAFAVSVLGTRAVLRRADRLGLVQIANARSSHVQPTPSGGGVGIVAAGLLVTLALIPTRPLAFGI